MSAKTRDSQDTAEWFSVSIMAELCNGPAHMALKWRQAARKRETWELTKGNERTADKKTTTNVRSLAAPEAEVCLKEVKSSGSKNSGSDFAESHPESDLIKESFFGKKKKKNLVSWRIYTVNIKELWCASKTSQEYSDSCLFHRLQMQDIQIERNAIVTESTLTGGR